MDRFRDSHNKSDRERQRPIPYDITYMWNLKYDTNEHMHETETDSWRADLWLSGVGGRGGKDWGFEIRRCKLVYTG